MRNPSVMRTGPPATSIYSSCGPAMTRSARVELHAGVDSTRAVFRRRFWGLRYSVSSSLRQPQ